MDAEHFKSKPHLAERFSLNFGRKKDLNNARAVGRQARMALDNDDWGYSVRTKVGRVWEILLAASYGAV